MVLVEVDYFEDYIAKHELPEWFLKQEKYQLSYSVPSSKTETKSFNDLFQIFDYTRFGLLFLNIGCRFRK